MDVRPTRRTAVLGGAALALATIPVAAHAATGGRGRGRSTGPTTAPTATATPSATVAPTVTTGLTGLAAAAATSGRRFGVAPDAADLADERCLALLASGEFSSVTPANSMKWASTEAVRGEHDFTDAEELVALASAHGTAVRGHTLAWHNQMPAWVGGLATTEVEAAMTSHIAAEVGHFAGRVAAWDVVNEPFDDDGTFRDTVYTRAMGEDYVATALTAARAADPDSRLYLNDYTIDGLGAKSDAMYALAGSLLDAGVPLDGIGVQGHLDIQYGFPTGMRENLQRFADLGLEVAVTELDVRMTLPADADDLEQQIAYYAGVVEACTAVDGCVGVTTWGITDAYSWVPGTFTGQGQALLWDEDVVAKPELYAAVLAALAAA